MSSSILIDLTLIEILHDRSFRIPFENQWTFITEGHEDKLVGAAIDWRGLSLVFLGIFRRENPLLELLIQSLVAHASSGIPSSPSMPADSDLVSANFGSSFAARPPAGAPIGGGGGPRSRGYPPPPPPPPRPPALPPSTPPSAPLGAPPVTCCWA